MPNTSNAYLLTQDTANATGQPVRWNYGYVWATGIRAAYLTLENTASNYTTSWMPAAGPFLDWTRIGFWWLGEGEMDGCAQLCINGIRAYNSEFDDLAAFHFHSGQDAIIGSGDTASSRGTDQGLDAFWLYMPTAVTPLHYSRTAYYALSRKQPSLYNIYSGADTSGSSAQENGNNWADLNPIGMWRGLRCRIFDADGYQTGYAFTTNPVWHIVDQYLRRKIKPDFNIFSSGPTLLTAAESACFDWQPIAETAAYCAQQIAQTYGGSRARFTHNNSYTSATSLVDVVSTMLRCMRGRVMKGAGNKLQIISDQPRSSSFTFDRTHKLPGSLEFSDRAVTAAPNQLRAKFRSLLVPSFGAISSITLPDHGNPLVTCYEAVPCIAGDYICIGNTGTNYDREWQLLTPQPGGLAVDSEGNPTQFALVTQGSNYPASWLDSSRPTDQQKRAYAGLSQSRFKERTCVFDHKANQYARGAIAPGVPRQRVIVPQDVDYGTSTYDQAARLTLYEKFRSLGADTFSDGAFTAPYVTPKVGKLTVPLFAQDVNGAQAIALQPSDRVTVDSTVDFDYAGDYEVDEPLDVAPYTAKQTGAGQAATPTGGTLSVPVTEYNEAAFVDSSNLDAAGWADVPGSDPSVNPYTGVPLADGGSLAFLSGGISSGGVVPLPSGYPGNQWLGWTTPQGYIEYGHDLHIIRYEQIDSNLQVTLNYEDGEGNRWPGDSGFFICAWISQTSTTYTAATNQQWLTAVLAGSGAEEILLGWVSNYGAGAAGTGGGYPSTIVLPSGWSFANVIAVAFPYSNGGAPTGHQAHVMSCSVDGSGNCTFAYSDGSNVWDAPVQVFIFGYKNNGGTVTDVTTSGVRDISIPVGTTETPLTFRVMTAVLSDQSTSNPAPDKPTALALPGGVAGASLQAIVSPASFQDDGNPSHGVRSLYLDQSLGMNATMEDGEGHVKFGDGTLVAVLCE